MSTECFPASTTHRPHAAGYAAATCPGSPSGTRGWTSCFQRRAAVQHNRVETDEPRVGSGARSTSTSATRAMCPPGTESPRTSRHPSGSSPLVHIASARHGPGQAPDTHRERPTMRLERSLQRDGIANAGPCQRLGARSVWSADRPPESRYTPGGGLNLRGRWDRARDAPMTSGIIQTARARVPNHSPGTSAGWPRPSRAGSPAASAADWWQPVSARRPAADSHRRRGRVGGSVAQRHGRGGHG